MHSPTRRLPDWIRVRAPGSRSFVELKGLVEDLSLNTVCESAHCPNIGECWHERTATFMILGDVCTRGCGFCAVRTGRPPAVDEDEPGRVAEAVSRLGLRHAVITSVSRDDLPDGGAAAFARTLEEIHRRCPGATVEVLVPDFGGDWDSLAAVLEAGPDIVNHNLETVPRLYRTMRPQARYQRSLELLSRAAELGPAPTKSGIMLGAGEREEEIESTIGDLAGVGCQILTVGQYLSPSPRHLPVARYAPPEEFARWRRVAQDLGFLHVESGPLVRSSYHAERQVGKVTAGSRSPELPLQTANPRTGEALR